MIRYCITSHGTAVIGVTRRGDGYRALADFPPVVVERTGATEVLAGAAALGALIDRLTAINHPAAGEFRDLVEDAESTSRNQPGR